MARPVSILLLVLAAALAGSCARSDAEQAALELAARAAGGGVTTYDLEYRREIDGGDVWRVAPRPPGSAGDQPRATHLGVIVCMAGDRPAEAVRFSYLHWEPVACEDRRAKLKRVSRTPEQDAKELGQFISPPRGNEDDPALSRLSG